jgi:hypothetical protein
MQKDQDVPNVTQNMHDRWTLGISLTDVIGMKLTLKLRILNNVLLQML